MSTRDEDFVEHLFVASTHDYILVFTNTGRVYWLKVYEIPELSAAGKGKAIASLVSLQPGESVRALLTVRDLEEEGKYVFFVTRSGTVKKTPLKDFSNVMSRGIIAIGIEKEDELVAASCTDGNQIVFLATHDGMAIRFDEEDVRSMGRPAYGVRGMDLRARRLHRGHGDHSEGAQEGQERRRSTRRTSSCRSPSRATASALTWMNTACRPVAARASSTSRPPRATARSFPSCW